MHLPAHLQTSFTHTAQKLSSVGVVQENGFSSIAPTQDVIKRAIVLDPEGAGHVIEPAQSSPHCQ